LFSMNFINGMLSETRKRQLQEKQN
jgi:hypothetical protein